VILKKENGYKVSGGAGTPGYQAPEVLQRLKYGTSADIWSLGITIYELLERARPFHRNEDALRDYRIVFHTDVTPEAKSLVRGMLERDPAKRLGCGADGIEEIKRHKFFAGIDWTKMNNREVKPPHQPELDRANCSADFELQDQFFSDKKEIELTDEQQLNFKGFNLNCEFNATMLPPHLQPGYKKGKKERPTGAVSSQASTKIAPTVVPGTIQVIVGEKNPNAGTDANGHHFEQKGSSPNATNNANGSSTLPNAASSTAIYKETVNDRKDGHHHQQEQTGRPKSSIEEDMIEPEPVPMSALPTVPGQENNAGNGQNKLPALPSARISVTEKKGDA
jgi:serine/threonine protein kinase